MDQAIKQRKMIPTKKDLGTTNSNINPAAPKIIKSSSCELDVAMISAIEESSIYKKDSSNASKMKLDFCWNCWNETQNSFWFENIG